MIGKVQCSVHGEQSPAFVCHHLTGDSTGLGFHPGEPEPDDPRPTAWCDQCEGIRAKHGGWNDASEKLTKISLLCLSCYERARIRNTRPAVTLDDFAGLRWKCGSCAEWHTGPCLDFSYDAPHYWTKEHERQNSAASSAAIADKLHAPTFLDQNYCAIDNEHFFVRGIIALPVIGTAESLCWGVWGSLSHQNFQALLKRDSDPKRADLPPMFSWLSTQIPEYPDTLSLKMYAHVQPANGRPRFELEPTTHPLSREYHHGIEPARVKEIMLGRLPETE